MGAMRKITPALLSIALLLGGCTPPPPPATLRQTCEAVQAALKDSGEGADATRVAALLVRVQAIHDAGDATSREALAPVLAAGRNAAGGDEEAVAEMLAAYLPFMVQCATAGALVPTASPSTSPTPVATPEEGECKLVAGSVVDLILDGTDRTAVASASLRGGKGPWLIALKLRSGEVGVWLADSFSDPTSVQSVNVLAGQLGGWDQASSTDYDPARVPLAAACVGG